MRKPQKNQRFGMTAEFMGDLIDINRDHKTGRLTNRPGSSDTANVNQTSGVVRSMDGLRAGSVIGFGPDPARKVIERDKLNPLVEFMMPTAEHMADQTTGILIGPALQGGFARAQTAGRVAFARVNFSESSHTHATMVAGQVDLASGNDGYLILAATGDDDNQLGGITGLANAIVYVIGESSPSQSTYRTAWVEAPTEGIPASGTRDFRVITSFDGANEPDDMVSVTNLFSETAFETGSHRGTVGSYDGELWFIINEDRQCDGEESTTSPNPDPEPDTNPTPDPEPDPDPEPEPEPDTNPEPEPDPDPEPDPEPDMGPCPGYTSGRTPGLNMTVGTVLQAEVTPLGAGPFAILSGTLPAGAALDSNSGLIFGTVQDGGLVEDTVVIRSARTDCPDIVLEWSIGDPFDLEIDEEDIPI